MNILHLSAVKKWGGGEHQIENLIRELQTIEHSVDNYVLCVKNSEFHEILKQTNFQVLYAPLAVKLDLRYVFKMIRVCRKHKIDLIHIHDPTALTLSVMATKLAKLPPFIFSKKTSFPIKNRRQTLYKYNHPKIKRILCVSEMTKKIASERITDDSKLVTVYHGTSRNKNIKPLFTLREKFNIPEGKIIVGTIANHIRAKDLETWIEIVDHVIKKMNQQNFHFIQIGSFTNRTPAYLDKIEERGLNKFITFTGFMQDAAAFIPQFDISLLTSQSEGLPQFIYESFYYKVPMVSTNVGGIPEIISDGENGLLSNPFEAESLANKLIALSADKVLQQKFAENSVKKLEENYTTGKMAEKTLAEYKKVLYGKS